MINIETPRGTIVQTKNGTAKLEWDKNFVADRTQKFSRAQSFVDSEVLRGCAKYITFRTGMLMKSGTLGTVIGSGEVKYIAPYARRQYYHGKSNGQRGRLWFVRWKTNHKEEVLQKAKTLTGGK